MQHAIKDHDPMAEYQDNGIAEQTVTCTASTCPVHKIPYTPSHNHSHTMQLAKFNSFVLNFIGFASIQQNCHDSINFNIVDLASSALV